MINEESGTTSTSRGQGGKVDLVEPAPPGDARVMSPVPRAVDQGPSDLPGLLGTLTRSAALLTRGKLSDKEKREVLAELGAISQHDVSRVCDDMRDQTMRALTMADDYSKTKICPPPIDEGGKSIVPTPTSRDFSARIQGGFGGNGKGSVRLQDVLLAVNDGISQGGLNSQGGMSLLRRALRDPARQFMEDIVKGGATLGEVYSHLQDHYSDDMNSMEATAKLDRLMSQPIENLDDFLGDMLHLSIASNRDNMAAGKDINAGYTMAMGNVNRYLNKNFPHTFSILKQDLNHMHATKKKMSESEIYLNYTRKLRMHRAALESQGRRRGPRISEISDGGDDKWGLNDHRVSEVHTARNADMGPNEKWALTDSIRSAIRDEMKSQDKQDVAKEGVQIEEIKAMIQGISQEQARLGEKVETQARRANYSTPVMQEGFGWNNVDHMIQANNGSWVENMAIPNPPAQSNGLGYPRTMGQSYMGMRSMGQYPPRQVRWASDYAPRGPYQGRSGYGGMGGNPNYQPVTIANRNMGGFPQLGQRQDAGRGPLSAEAYKDFANGRCFACGLMGHSYRNCEVFGPVAQVRGPLCPDCEKHGIKAYHENCQGKNYKYHLSVGQHPGSKVEASQSAQVSEMRVLEGLGPYGMEYIPVYHHEGNMMPKNA